jgi:hypothetical protein
MTGIEIPVVLSSAKKVFDLATSYKQSGLDAHSVLRVLRVECLKNLRLLDALRPNIEGKSVYKDADILMIVKYLEIDIFALVGTLAENNTKIRRILHSNLNIQWNSESDREDDTTIQPNNLLDLVESTYIKIWVIQKLVEEKPKGIALKNINYLKRLENIKKGLSKIEQSIKDHIDK